MRGRRPSGPARRRRARAAQQATFPFSAPPGDENARARRLAGCQNSCNPRDQAVCGHRHPSYRARPYRGRRGERRALVIRLPGISSRDATAPSLVALPRYQGGRAPRPASRARDPAPPAPETAPRAQGPRANGDSGKEAVRALKRRLSDVVHKAMTLDHDATIASPRPPQADAA